MKISPSKLSADQPRAHLLPVLLPPRLTNIEIMSPRVSAQLSKMGSRIYACPVGWCGKEFDSKQGCGRHVASHDHDELRKPLIDNLRSVAEKLQQPPSVSRYQRNGRFGRDLVESVFGSWSKALDEAGLFEAPNYEHTRPELLDEIRRLNDHLGRVPRRHEMEETGKYGSSVYTERFGSWNEALREAGLEPFERVNIPDDDLLCALKDLATDIGRTPIQREMNSMGEFHSATYERAFGTWNDALEVAGLELNLSKDISKEDLIRDIRAVSEVVGSTPTQRQMNQHSTYSTRTLQLHFGSYNRAIKAAGFEPNHSLGVDDPHYGPGWTEHRRDYVRKRSGYVCEGCGMGQKEHLEKRGERLHVHHIVPARKFPDNDPRANLMANLVPLCHDCHKEWEYSTGHSPAGVSLPEYCDPPEPTGGVTLTDFTELDS